MTSSSWGGRSDPGAPDEDSITDFAANDTLVLADILSLAGPAATGDELDDFLQFAFDGGDTRLDIDQDGAGDFVSPEARMVFQAVDLVGGAGSQADLIDVLLARQLKGRCFGLPHRSC